MLPTPLLSVTVVPITLAEAVPVMFPAPCVVSMVVPPDFPTGAFREREAPTAVGSRLTVMPMTGAFTVMPPMLFCNWKVLPADDELATVTLLLSSSKKTLVLAFTVRLVAIT